MDPKANKTVMKLKTTSRNLKPARRTGKITSPNLCTSTTARFTMSPATVYLLFFTLFGRSLRRPVDLDLSRLRLHGTGRICPEPVEVRPFLPVCTKMCKFSVLCCCGVCTVPDKFNTNWVKNYTCIFRVANSFRYVGVLNSSGSVLVLV